MSAERLVDKQNEEHLYAKLNTRHSAFTGLIDMFIMQKVLDFCGRVIQT